MALAETFQEIVDSLPSDWTDLEFDLRVEETRYIDAATLLVQVNAQPYSRHDWHWRLLVAHQFGHAAAAPVVHGTLTLLDEAGIQRRARAAPAAHGARGDGPDVGPAASRAAGVPPHPRAVGRPSVAVRSGPTSVVSNAAPTSGALVEDPELDVPVRPRLAARARRSCP